MNLIPTTIQLITVMGIKTLTLKRLVKNSQLFGVAICILVVLNSCRSVNETIIQNIGDSNPSWINNNEPIYILCSSYYLRRYDTLYNSKRSPFSVDRDVVKLMVSDALSELYSADSNIIEKFVLCTDPDQIKSSKYIEVQVHLFINIWEIIPFTKVRESVCVKSNIMLNKHVIKTHEVWGFRRTLGAFSGQIHEGYTQCEINGYKLNVYCIKKCLVELSK